MVRITCVTYQCYIWISGRARKGGGEGQERAGDDNQDNIIHNPTSLSELWDLPSNRHIVHTAFDFFSFLSQNNICNHWSHTTRHSTRWKNDFLFLSAAGSRAKGVGEQGRGLRSRQAGDVSLRRGTFWLAGGTVGLVLKQQDPAKTRNRRWLKLHSDCRPKSNF